MKVYLAGQWDRRADFPAIAAKIEAAGHTITERWWDHEDTPQSKYPSNEDDDFLTARAIDDFIGVVKADTLVLMQTGKSEGKAVETGIAIAGGKPVILVGTRHNLFHYLPNVHIVESVDAAVEMLQ